MEGSFKKSRSDAFAGAEASGSAGYSFRSTPRGRAARLRFNRDQLDRQRAGARPLDPDVLLGRFEEHITQDLRAGARGSFGFPEAAEEYEAHQHFIAERDASLWDAYDNAMQIPMNPVEDIDEPNMEGVAAVDQMEAIVNEIALSRGLAPEDLDGHFEADDDGYFVWIDHTMGEGGRDFAPRRRGTMGRPNARLQYRRWEHRPRRDARFGL